MSAAPFVFSMVFRADVAAAKAGLSSVQEGLGKVVVEAGKAVAATAAEAAELDALAAAAARAALGAQDLAAARRAAMAPQLPLAQLPMADTTLAFRATATAAEQMRDVASGAAAGLAQVGAASNRAMQEAAAYRDTLDAVRASFNPLFAASRQYAAQLDAIAAAEQMGAISAREAAAARDRAAQAMAPVVPAGPDLAALRASFDPLFAASKQYEAELGRIAEAERLGAIDARVAGEARARAAAALPGATLSTEQHRAAQEALRASFNPLFAASREYEAQLGRIAAAERQGAISAREAAAARERAAQAMAPVVPGQVRPGGAGGGSFVTANLAAQGNDIAMMAMAGQNPMMLALQQGTQVSQVLNTLEKGTSIPKTLAAGFMSMVNPVSLVTIGVIGLGAFGIQAIGKLIPPTKTFNEAMKSLTSQTEAYATAQSKARGGDLAQQFGLAAKAARELLTEIAALEKAQIGRDLGSLRNEMTGGSMFGLRDGNAQYATLAGMFEEGNVWTRSQPDQRSTPKTFEVNRDLFKFEAVGKTGSLEDQIAVAEKLRDSFRAAADASGERSAAEQEWLGKIDAMLLRLREAKAIQDNEAGKARADDLTRSLERQTELTRLGVQYGGQSAELRAAEARQARELLATELERAGIAKGSPEWNEAMAAQARKVFADRDAADAARREAQQAYLGQQDVAIAGLNRERQLLGASNAERIRQNALAEAEVEIGRAQLSNDEARERRAKAIAKAEAEIALESERAARAQQLARITDGIDAQIGLARDPLTKADLQAAREYQEVLARTNDTREAEQAADRARARSLDDALSGSQLQIASLSDELALRQRVAAQVAAGVVAASDADRVMRQELELLPLIRAEARATGVEKQRLTGIITGLRVASEALAAEERRGAANAALRGSAERIAAAKVELALIGQTAETRARVLGLIEAERTIRETGMNAASEQAQALRDGAAGLARMNAEIERQGAAWKAVQSAGESAIDGVLDKLTGGDVKGALAELAQDAAQLFLDLGVKNPLKNAVLGTDHATMADVGGVGGLLGRLMGGPGFDEAAVVRMGSAPVQAMTVAASSVQLTAGAVNINGAPGFLPGVAANMAGAPGLPGMAGAVSGAVSGSGPVAVGAARDVARQIYDFFITKGLAPHQAAAIVGHAKAESGFNPTIPGDGGNAVGLWQHNGPRMRGLLEYAGGRAALGDPRRQMEYVWRELMTSESASLRKLKAAPDLKSATWAMQGFERPSGYKADQFGSGMHWDKRLDGASQALVQFGGAAQAASVQTAATGPAMAGVANAAQAASAGVDTMAGGMAQFGGSLQQILGAAIGGDKGGMLSGLLGLGVKFMTGGLAPAAAPGFAAGGYTGAGHPAAVAGVVHAGEYVFDAAATSRIGVDALEAMRAGRGAGYASGGYVSGAVPRPASAGSAAAGGGAAAPASQGAPILNFDMRGAIGGAELQRGVKTAIKEAFKSYDRDQLPGRVKSIFANPHRRQG